MIYSYRRSYCTSPRIHTSICKVTEISCCSTRFCYIFWIMTSSAEHCCLIVRSYLLLSIILHSLMLYCRFTRSHFGRCLKSSLLSAHRNSVLVSKRTTCTHVRARAIAASLQIEDVKAFVPRAYLKQTQTMMPPASVAKITTTRIITNTTIMIVSGSTSERTHRWIIISHINHPDLSRYFGRALGCLIGCLHGYFKSNMLLVTFS